MAPVYNKIFERSLIGLIGLFIILSFVNLRLIPIVFAIPAIIFFVRMIKDFRMKNDKQASRNLTTTIIFIIITVLIYKLS